MNGLDAATRTVTITEDALDAEIERLSIELGMYDPTKVCTHQPAGAVPKVDLTCRACKADAVRNAIE